MSLKARLRGAIVALVTAVVVVMSLLYLSDFTKASFSAASVRADLIADQFHIYLENRLKVETARLGVNPSSSSNGQPPGRRSSARIPTSPSCSRLRSPKPTLRLRF